MSGLHLQHKHNKLFDADTFLHPIRYIFPDDEDENFILLLCYST